MEITYKGPGFYECSSETDPDTKYHIDLFACGGLGECDCWDFIGRRKQRWKGVKKNYDIFRCKHLRRVRNHVLDQIILHMANKQKQKERNYGKTERPNGDGRAGSGRVSERRA